MSKQNDGKKKKRVTIMPEEVVHNYSRFEEASFLDPSEPAPHAVFYYETISLPRPSMKELTTPVASYQGNPETFERGSHLQSMFRPTDPAEFDLEAAKERLKSVKEKQERDKDADKDEKKEEKEFKPPKTFGTWDGVFARCLLNIFGVIMFMRLPWVVGQAGVLGAIGIILVSSVVTVITTLSMSAICTNGQMPGGGAYFLISRSLGPEIGGSIGVLFSIANAVAVSLYVIGFAETLTDVVRGSFDFKFDEADIVNDYRIYGTITNIVLLLMCLIGIGWVIKVQMFLLVFLIATIVSVIGGSFWERANDVGFVGYRMELLSSNLMPQFTENENFQTVFSVFFPAVTGIMAGVNISGQLENAAESIPKGTLWAIGVAGVCYSLLAVIAGATVTREGLQNYLLLFRDLSLWDGLIIIGIFSATLSSAIASLVGAPRVFQKICRDQILPKQFNFFAKGRGAGDEPIRGYLLTFVIAVLATLIGALNAIAPLISMFFMVTYAFINLACFMASTAKTPGWRPSFKYYNPYVACFGFFACMVAMFVINPWYAIAALFIAFVLVIYIWKNRPDNLSWGPAMPAHKQTLATKWMRAFDRTQVHVKNYRPQPVVMVGDPHDETRAPLASFANLLSKGKGLVRCCNVLLGEYDERVHELAAADTEARKFYSTQKYKVATQTVISASIRGAVQTLLHTSASNMIKPNILVIGFKSDWKREIPKHEHAGSTVRLHVSLIAQTAEEARAVAEASSKLGMPMVRHESTTPATRSRAASNADERSEEPDERLIDALRGALIVNEDAGTTQYNASVVAAALASRRSSMAPAQMLEMLEADGALPNGGRRAHKVETEAPASLMGLFANPVIADPDSSEAEESKGSSREDSKSSATDDDSSEEQKDDNDEEEEEYSDEEESGDDEEATSEEESEEKVSSEADSSYESSEDSNEYGDANSESTSVDGAKGRKGPNGPKGRTRKKKKAKISEPLVKTERSASVPVRSASMRASAMEKNAFQQARSNGVCCAENYVNMIRDAFELQKAVVIVHDWSRVPSNPSGTIDVWWLVDDGGLTILLPWLISRKKEWSKAKLRILAIPTNIATLARETSMLEDLVKQFRIDAEVVIVTPDEVEVDKSDLREYHKTYENAADPADDSRTLRYLHLAKLMQTFSKNATALFVSLPFPRPEISSKSWLAWLDLLTQDLPPVVFVRGNQENVLTFYV